MTQIYHSKVRKMSKENSQLKIGCHVSIAGGIEKSVVRARALGCNTMQVFSKNSSTWKEKVYKEEEVKKLRENLKNSRIAPVFIHASYLLNLASPSEEIYKKSIKAFIEEIKRAHLLFSDLPHPYVIIHPGAHTGSGEEFGLQRIIKALNISLEKTEDLNLKTIILLETTAGSGSQLGYSFEHLKRMIAGVRNKKKIGICLDTCHVFSAGYDISNKDGLEKTLEDLDNNISFENLKVIHLNDSKFPLGSHKDRHMHIGKGFIGLQGFKNIVNHPQLKDLPFILETPKREDKDDFININLVKRLILE